MRKLLTHAALMLQLKKMLIINFSRVFLRKAISYSETIIFFSALEHLCFILVCCLDAGTI